MPERGHLTPGRHLPWHLSRRRHLLIRAGGLAALLAVVGPGLLAGLSDDDPAGITTYSILGAKYGYELLWVLSVSTAALIVFHELAVRLGIVTGKGLLTLVREHYGGRAAALVLSALVIANTGTLCAEFAGVAAGADLLGGVSRYISVPFAAVGVSLLVLRGTFRYVEHILLALSTVFVAYVISGLLAHPIGERPRRASSSPTCRSTARRCWSPSRRSGRRWHPGGWHSSSHTPSTRS
jgi:Mn2+/Fe2+ NRAMP family transporter